MVLVMSAVLHRKVTVAYRCTDNGVKWGGAEISTECKHMDPVRDWTFFPTPRKTCWVQVVKNYKAEHFGIACLVIQKRSEMSRFPLSIRCCIIYTPPHAW